MVGGETTVPDIPPIKEASFAKNLCSIFSRDLQSKKVRRKDIT